MFLLIGIPNLYEGHEKIPENIQEVVLMVKQVQMEAASNKHFSGLRCAGSIFLSGSVNL